MMEDLLLRAFHIIHMYAGRNVRPFKNRCLRASSIPVPNDRLNATTRYLAG